MPEAAETVETSKESLNIEAPKGNPLQKDNTTTLEYAVAKLMKEPEKVIPESEPEAAAEEVREDTPEEEEEEVTEVTESEASDIEDEEESEEDAQATSQEDEADDEEELKYYNVKLDGEEFEVTLDELRNGYQRQKDYTKKTQALAETRKATQAKQEELDKLHETFMHQATLANELLNRDLKAFEKVDWEKLKTEDPVAFMQQKIELQEVQERQKELIAQAAQAVQFQNKTKQEAQQKAVQEEQSRITEAFPEWHSEDKRNEHQIKIADFARKHGFTDEELATVYQARDLVILDKAMKYDELQSNRKTAIKKKRPPVRKIVKPGVKKPKGESRRKRVTARKEQLRKSGSLRDAAALMDEMRRSNAIAK